MHQVEKTGRVKKKKKRYLEFLALSPKNHKSDLGTPFRERSQRVDLFTAKPFGCTKVNLNFGNGARNSKEAVEEAVKKSTRDGSHRRSRKCYITFKSQKHEGKGKTWHKFIKHRCVIVKRGFPLFCHVRILYLFQILSQKKR